MAMKLTKRMKNSMVQGTIFSSVFLLILSGIFIISLYPRLLDIEEKKILLQEVSQKNQEVNKNGLDFTKFKNSLWSLEDSYTINLLENINQDFYDDNFSNTGSVNYTAFLDSLESKILNAKVSQEYIQKEKQVSSLLPTYDQYNSSPWDLSDFFFINYIENLLYSFNLSSQGDIGIWDLENADLAELQRQEISNTQDVNNNLEETIYRIPLSFNIVGQKWDIVDFIHYFENVSRISIAENGFQVYRDNFIRKVIEGDKVSTSYNIYENQLSDIANISFIEYPDSSSRETSWLIDAMKWNQSREKYEIDVELWFYVWGVPRYKIQDFITTFFSEYTDVSKKISSEAKKYKSQEYKYKQGGQIVAISNLQSLDVVNIALWKEVLALRKKFSQESDIQSVYEQAISLSEQFGKIKANYELQLKTLAN